MSSPREALSAMSSALGLVLVVGIILLLFTGGLPCSHQMVVFAVRIVTDLKDDRAQPPTAEADRAELLRIVAPPVNQICLVEDLLRVFKADAVLPLDLPALPWIEFQPHTVNI